MNRIPAVVIALATFSVLLPGRSGAAEEKIGALGRIMPDSGIVTLGGPGADTVAQVLVKPGDEVAEGAPLVVLRGREAARAELQQAQDSLQSLRKTGPLAIQMQELKLKEAQMDRDLTASRLDRLGKLDGETVSPPMMEQRRYQAAQAELAFGIAGRELERLRTDTQAALDRAERQAAQAQARFDATTLTAPFAGTVLDVPAHVGDGAGQALVRIANLRAIVVWADVYEGDILKVKEGMRASVSGNALPAALKGEVVSVGRIISEGSKVAKVKIRLADDSGAAARLLNTEVNISLFLQAPAPASAAAKVP